VVINGGQQGRIGRFVDARGVVKNFILHGLLNRIGQLEAVAAEELDAVVAPWIMRGRDDHAGLKSMCSCKEGDRRSGDDSCAFDAHSCFTQACGESSRDPGARLASVAPEHNLGLRVISFCYGVGERVAEG
jgi:hypothetical protein